METGRWNKCQSLVVLAGQGKVIRVKPGFTRDFNGQGIDDMFEDITTLGDW